MATTTSNLAFGPAEVTYDGTVMGATLGDVEIEVITSTFDLKADQLGDQAAEVAIIGRTAMVRVPFAEDTIDNVAKFLPGATLVADSGTPANKKVLGDQAVGQKAIANSLAKVLLLKDIVGADTPGTDANEWFTANKAFPTGNFTRSMGLNNQRVISIEFKCLPDPDDSNRPFIFGDTTAAS